MERTLKLVNGGTLDLTGDHPHRPRASSPSILTSDAANGLQLGIDSARLRGQERVQAPTPAIPAGYARAGYSRPCQARSDRGQTFALSGLTSTTAGKTDFLRVTLTLPATAGNDFQGKNSSVNFAFNAAIRGATDK